MPQASVGDIVIDYERSGSGPPLLAIMGMSGTSLHWGDRFAAALREHFELIVYDHRGVGRSSRLTGEVSIRQMARDATGLMRALQLEGAHVLGISMGGMIAQELALSQPALVRTLTLGCTYCGGPGSTLAGEGGESLVEAINSGDAERALRAAFEVNLSPDAAQDPELWRMFQEISAQRRVAQSVIMAQLKACAAHDTNARLPALSPPALVIHGTADRLIPVENGRLIAARIPRSRLVVMEDVGHLFFWEEPERAAELIRSHAAGER